MSKQYEHNGYGDFCKEIKAISNVKITLNSVYKENIFYTGKDGGKKFTVTFYNKSGEEYLQTDTIDNHENDSFIVNIFWDKIVPEKRKPARRVK